MPKWHDHASLSGLPHGLLQLHLEFGVDVAQDDAIPGYPDEPEIFADHLSFPDDSVVDHDHPAGRLAGVDMAGKGDLGEFLLPVGREFLQQRTGAGRFFSSRGNGLGPKWSRLQQGGGFNNDFRLRLYSFRRASCWLGHYLNRCNNLGGNFLCWWRLRFRHSWRSLRRLFFDGRPVGCLLIFLAWPLPEADCQDDHTAEADSQGSLQSPGRSIAPGRGQVRMDGLQGGDFALLAFTVRFFQGIEYI